MATEPTTDTGAREGYDNLEQALIAEYLRGQGLTQKTVWDLPEEQAKKILRAASLYASVRLSDVEARAHLIAELHGGGRPL